MQCVKKIISILIVTMLSFALAACGQVQQESAGQASSSVQSGNTQEKQDSQKDTVSSESEETAQTEQTKTDGKF